MFEPIEAVAAQLQKTLSAFVKASRAPGAAAGIVLGSELAWSAGVGFADVATRRPSQPSLLYDIASITKTFTGTAVMQLRDGGLLDLDAAAVEWLPELRHAQCESAPIEAVTIRRMLSHESGLPSEPPGTDWSVPQYEGDAERTLSRANEITVSTPPNQHRYSDLAYQLLGEIVSRIVGKPFATYLTEAILQPLGLSSTSFDPRVSHENEAIATGYGWRALTDDLPLAPSMPPVWSEGGLWSCVPDLARWVSFQLGGHTARTDQASILAPASLQEMHQPRYLADRGWTQAWGISWCGTRQEDVVWIGHSGGVPGFTGSICFDPDSQVGAVALVNATTASAALAMDLAGIARRAIQDQPVVITPAAPTPTGLLPLLGYYARPDLGGWLLGLEWKDGKLTVTTPESHDWHLSLAATTDPDRFVVETPPLSGTSMAVRRREDGSVGALFLMDHTWVRLDPSTT